MTLTENSVLGSSRVVVVGQLSSLARGRASEFRHRGLTLVERPTAASALVEVSKDRGAIVLVPTDLGDMPSTDFVDVLRSIARVSVIAGLSSQSSHQTVSELFDHGVSSAVLLPATPSRLAEAVQACGVTGGMEDIRLELGSITMDQAGFRATWHGDELDLTPQSFATLAQMLVAHPRVMTAADIDGSGNDRPHIVDRARSAVSRLRSAFLATAPHRPSPIVTVHGVGYRLEPGPGAQSLQVSVVRNATTAGQASS